MTRLAVVMASGLVFFTGVAAGLVLGRFNYMSWLAVCQLLALGAWCVRRRLGAVPGMAESPAPSEEGDRWTVREAAAALAAGAALLVLLQLPCQLWTADGHVARFNKDWGFYAQMTLALQEGRVATSWAILLGDQAADAGAREMWYHWGPMFLGAALRGLTGIPAAQAVLLVVNTVLNGMMLAALAALARAFCRLPAWQCVLAAGVAFVSTDALRLLPEVLNLVGSWLPFEVFHYWRMPLAMMFSYKYEAVQVLAAVLLWQSCRPALALGMLYFAACSAPHTVAFGGAAAGTLAGLGLLLRDRSMLRAGAQATSVLLAGWGTTRFLFGLSMSSSDKTSLATLAGVEQLARAVRFAAMDFVVTLIVSGVLATGCIYLILRGRAAGSEPMRLLGWVCLCGIAGSSLALHAMNCSESPHVVIMTHSVLIMPAGALGLLCMACHSRGRRWRAVALSLFIGGGALGAHTIVANRMLQGAETWSAADIQVLREYLRGRPVGYLARADRAWWIPKHGTLGAMLDSRCIRLNPIDQRREPHFNEVTSLFPLRFQPPRAGESEAAWSLRLARRVGVRHVIETWQDPLPQAIRSSLTPVCTASGIILYAIGNATPAVARAD